MVMFDELADWLVGPRRLSFQWDGSATALVLIAGSAAWSRGRGGFPFGQWICNGFGFGRWVRRDFSFGG